MHYMDEPDDTAGISEEVARDLLSWAKTIDRWSLDGSQCFLVSREGLRSATCDDVSDAMDQLRSRHSSPCD